MRRRIRIILLFPVITFLFVAGWVLYVIADTRTSNKIMPKRKINDVGREEESTANSGDVEVGLIEEIAEEHLEA